MEINRLPITLGHELVQIHFEADEEVGLFKEHDEPLCLEMHLETALALRDKLIDMPEPYKTPGVAY